MREQERTFNISLPIARDVLLYGYPAGDTPAERSSNERYFPRASDEIQGIEKDIGSVRIVAVMTEAKVEW